MYAPSVENRWFNVECLDAVADVFRMVSKRVSLEPILFNGLIVPHTRCPGRPAASACAGNCAEVLQCRNIPRTSIKSNQLHVGNPYTRDRMKRISILGSTGSIGRQCLSVVDSLPGRFKVEAIAGGSNLALIAEQARKHKPRIVSVAS